MTHTTYDHRVIIAATAKEFGVRTGAITEKPTANRWQDYAPRHTAIALCRDLCRMKLKDLAPIFNCALSGISKSREKASEQVALDRAYADRVTRIIRAVKK